MLQEATAKKRSSLRVYKQRTAIVVGVSELRSAPAAGDFHLADDTLRLASILSASGFAVHFLFQEAATKEQLLSVLNNVLPSQTVVDRLLLVIVAPCQHPSLRLERCWEFLSDKNTLNGSEEAAPPLKKADDAAAFEPGSSHARLVDQINECLSQANQPNGDKTATAVNGGPEKKEATTPPAATPPHEPVYAVKKDRKVPHVLAQIIAGSPTSHSAGVHLGDSAGALNDAAGIGRRTSSGFSGWGLRRSTSRADCFPKTALWFTSSSGVRKAVADTLRRDLPEPLQSRIEGPFVVGSVKVKLPWVASYQVEAAMRSMFPKHCRSEVQQLGSDGQMGTLVFFSCLRQDVSLQSLGGEVGKHVNDASEDTLRFGDEESATASSPPLSGKNFPRLSAPAISPLTGRPYPKGRGRRLTPPPRINTSPPSNPKRAEYPDLETGTDSERLDPETEETDENNDSYSNSLRQTTSFLTPGYGVFTPSTNLMLGVSGFALGAAVTTPAHVVEGTVGSSSKHDTYSRSVRSLSQTGFLQTGVKGPNFFPRQIAPHYGERQPRLDFLRFGDKISLLSWNDAILGSRYHHDRCLPVAQTFAEKDLAIPRNFEYCVFQVEAVNTDNNSGSLGAQGLELFPDDDSPDGQGSPSGISHTPTHGRSKLGEQKGRHNQIVFGQQVRLLHVLSNRYLCAFNQTDDDESVPPPSAFDSRQVLLDLLHADHAEKAHGTNCMNFKFMPSGLMRTDGERVRVGDNVEMVSTICSSHLACASKQSEASSDASESEVEESDSLALEMRPIKKDAYDCQRGLIAGNKECVWTICPYHSRNADDATPDGHPLLHTGLSVLLFQKELEAFLTADAVIGEEQRPLTSWSERESRPIVGDPLMGSPRTRLGRRNKVRTAEHFATDTSTEKPDVYYDLCMSARDVAPASYVVSDFVHSSNALWLIEGMSPTKGGPIQWLQHRKAYRIKHVASGGYLSVTGRDTMGISFAPDDAQLVAFHPVNTVAGSPEENGYVATSSYCRIQFVMSKLWLYVANPKSDSMVGLAGRSRLKPLLSKDPVYDAVFALRPSSKVEFERLTSVCSMRKTLGKSIGYWLDQGVTTCMKPVPESWDSAHSQQDVSRKPVLASRLLPNLVPNGLDAHEVESTRDDLKSVSGAVLTSTAQCLVSLIRFCSDKKETFEKRQRSEDAEKSVLSDDGSTGAFQAEDASGSPTLMHDVYGVPQSIFASSGSSCPSKQAVLFSQRIHLWCLHLLQVPLLQAEQVLMRRARPGFMSPITLSKAIEAVSDQFSPLFQLAYHLLRQMVKDNLTLSLQLEPYIPFIEAQLGFNFRAMETLVQIYKGNFALLSRLKKDQIRSYLSPTPYLELLACVCVNCSNDDGEETEIGIRDNQNCIMALIEENDIGFIFPTRVHKGEVWIKPYLGWDRNASKLLTEPAKRAMQKKPSESFGESAHSFDESIKGEKVAASNTETGTPVRSFFDEVPVMENTWRVSIGTVLKPTGSEDDDTSDTFSSDHAEGYYDEQYGNAKGMRRERERKPSIGSPNTFRPRKMSAFRDTGDGPVLLSSPSSTSIISKLPRAVKPISPLSPLTVHIADPATDLGVPTLNVPVLMVPNIHGRRRSTQPQVQTSVNGAVSPFLLPEGSPVSPPKTVSPPKSTAIGEAIRSISNFFSPTGSTDSVETAIRAGRTPSAVSESPQSPDGLYRPLSKYTPFSGSLEGNPRQTPSNPLRRRGRNATRNGWIQLEGFISNTQESNTALIKHFEGTLNLWSMLCVDGDPATRKKVSNIIPFREALSGLHMNFFSPDCDSIRTAYATLARYLYIKQTRPPTPPFSFCPSSPSPLVSPFTFPTQPVLLEFSNLESAEISSESSKQNLLGWTGEASKKSTAKEFAVNVERLKAIAEKILRENYVQITECWQRNKLLTEVLKLVQEMLRNNLYDASEIKDLLPWVLRMLDPVTDRLYAAEVSNPPYCKQAGRIPEAVYLTSFDSPLQSSGAAHRASFFGRKKLTDSQLQADRQKPSIFSYNEASVMVMTAKVEACKLLIALMDRDAEPGYDFRSWIEATEIRGQTGYRLLASILLEVTLFEGNQLLYFTAFEALFRAFSETLGHDKDTGGRIDNIAEIDSTAVTNMAYLVSNHLTNPKGPPEKPYAYVITLCRHFKEVPKGDSLCVALLRTFTKVMELAATGAISFGTEFVITGSPRQEDGTGSGMDAGSKGGTPIRIFEKFIVPKSSAAEASGGASMDGGSGSLDATFANVAQRPAGVGGVFPLVTCQNLLDRLGLTADIAILIESKNSEVIKHSLDCGIALLEGGNLQVQRSLSSYFLSRDDEVLFKSLRDRIRDAISFMVRVESGTYVRGRRTSKISQRAPLSPSGVPFTPTAGTLSFNSRSPFAGIRSPDSTVTTGFTSGSYRAFFDGRTASQKTPRFNKQKLHLYKSRNLFHTREVMRYLQLFCEGHNTELQNYLREQGDNVHSFNLVSESLNFLEVVLQVSQMDEFMAEIALQTYNSLTEYCQGPVPGNQMCIVHGGMCLAVNAVFQDPTDGGVDFGIIHEAKPELVEQIRTAAVATVLSLLEGGTDKAVGAIMIGHEGLDLEVFRDTLIEIYELKKITAAGNPRGHDDDAAYALELGFNIFILFKTLQANYPSLQQFLEDSEATQYFADRTGRIEICRGSDLERVYFRVPEICVAPGLSEKTKYELLWRVRRNTSTERIIDFFEKGDSLIYELEYTDQYFTRDRPWRMVRNVLSGRDVPKAIRTLCRRYATKAELCMVYVAALTNCLIIAGDQVDQLVDGWSLLRDKHPMLHWVLSPIWFGSLLSFLALVQIVLLTIATVSLLASEAPLSAYRRYKSHQSANNRTRQLPPSADEPAAPSEGSLARGATYGELNLVLPSAIRVKNVAFDLPPASPASSTPRFLASPHNFVTHACSYPKNTLVSMYSTLTARLSSIKRIPPYVNQYLFVPVDPHQHHMQATLQACICTPSFYYFVVMLIFAALGIIYHPLFLSVHLLCIARTSDVLQNVIRAVTQNGKALILTCVLGMVVVYLFTVVAYTFFRDALQTDAGDKVCTSLIRCFGYALTHGVRSDGGLGDYMTDPGYASKIYGLQMAYEIFFFVLVIVILLNIIFGIIIDTFAELRAQRQSVEEDIRTKCFICGIEASEFDRHADGFRTHIKEDHNMWMYVFFLHHLRLKEVSEFTGQESFVYEKVQVMDLSFFPLNKALAVDHKKHEEDERVELIHNDEVLKTLEDIDLRMSEGLTVNNKDIQDVKTHLGELHRVVREVSQSVNAASKNIDGQRRKQMRYGTRSGTTPHPLNASTLGGSFAFT
ncbi:Inositol 1 [Diplonema papillatum]|nr:Inositol 1 [Diplonema papillatum]